MRIGKRLSIFSFVVILYCVSLFPASAAIKVDAVPSIIITTPTANRVIRDQYYDFIIPWIQTDSNLVVTGTLANVPWGGRLELVIDQNTGQERRKWPTGSDFYVTFPALAKGEHTLDGYIVDINLNRLPNPEAHVHLDQIGIGEILIVLGDSTSAGAMGNVAPPPVLNCQQARWHTDDCRNFEQADGFSDNAGNFGTGSSFLVELAAKLASRWGYPVFIMNEAWSTSDTPHFLNTLLPQAQFENRIKALRPTKWLINYGRNDFRGQVHCHLDSCGDPSFTPEGYASRLQAVIDHLKQTFGVTPEQIYLAEKFSYDMEADIFGTGDPLWEIELPKYFSAIRNVQVENPGVMLGPNLWDIFRGNNVSCAGSLTNSWLADYVHPNVPGYRTIADFWAEILAPQIAPIEDPVSKIYFPLIGQGATCPASGRGYVSEFDASLPGWESYSRLWGLDAGGISR